MSGATRWQRVEGGERLALEAGRGVWLLHLGAPSGPWKVEPGMLLAPGSWYAYAEPGEVLAPPFDGDHPEPVASTKPSEALKARESVERHVLELALTTTVANLARALGAERGTCRGCSAPVWWFTTSRGALQPIDPDSGLSHFSTCPEAGRFRRKGGQ